MQNLQKTLKAKLKSAKKIAVLGVGSDLRGDDFAGEFVAKELDLICKNKCRHPEVRFFFGSTAPENLTGEIKKFKPTHIVIIDSAELNKKPGSVKVLTLREIGGVSFSTHRLPTKIMVDYLRKSLACKFVIIGIQPKSLLFGKPFSREVRKALSGLLAALKEAII